MSFEEDRPPIEKRIEDLRAEDKSNSDITIILYNEGYKTSDIMHQKLSLRPLKGIKDRRKQNITHEKDESEEEPAEEPKSEEETKIGIDDRIRELEEQGMTKKEMAPVIYGEGYPTAEMMKRGLPLRSLNSKIKKSRQRGLETEEDLYAAVEGSTGGKGWLEEFKQMIRSQISRSRELTEVFSDIGLGILLASLSKAGMSMEEFRQIALKRGGLREALNTAGETAFKALEYYDTDLVSNVENERDEARAFASILEAKIEELVKLVDPRFRMERMIQIYLMSGGADMDVLSGLLDRWLEMEMIDIRLELMR